MTDPNEFVDVDEAFKDEPDYNPDEITFAEFTIVPGDDVNHAALVYWADGVSFFGGSTGCKWAISLYQGYHYNGQDLPIGDDAAQHVLETLADNRELEEYEWTAQNWTYFE